jgi:hypothetical protein
MPRPVESVIRLRIGDLRENVAEVIQIVNRLFRGKSLETCGHANEHGKENDRCRTECDKANSQSLVKISSALSLWRCLGGRYG